MSTASVGSHRVGDGRSWLPEGTVAAVVHDTLHELPDDGSTHWTTRLMAKRFGIGKDTVARIWRDHNLKPWKVDTFKVSNDPHFEEKLVDVVGLYLNPPERAVVFSFDEKTQVQALDRTQPSLPMKRGRGGTMTHDYKRHGTTDLFAAMNVGHRRGALRHEEVATRPPTCSAFFKLIDLHVPKRPRDPRRARQPLRPQGPAGGRVAGRSEARPLAPSLHAHLVVVAEPRRALVQRAHRATAPPRRVHLGARISIEAIEIWAEHWNDDPKPFVWHKTAEEIIDKVRRGRAALTQVKSATPHQGSPQS